IGKRKQGFLRNHAISQCTFLTPVGNRCITPCMCVKAPSRSRGVIPTAGGLSVHKGVVVCRNIRRHIQRYWILRRLCRSLSCSASRGMLKQQPQEGAVRQQARHQQNGGLAFTVWATLAHEPWGRLSLLRVPSYGV